MLWLGTALKYLKTNIFFYSCKNKHKKGKVGKTKKEDMLLIPENIADRVLSVCKTKIPTEYREKGIRLLRN